MYGYFVDFFSLLFLLFSFSSKSPFFHWLPHAHYVTDYPFWTKPCLGHASVIAKITTVPRMSLIFSLTIKITLPFFLHTFSLTSTALTLPRVSSPSKKERTQSPYRNRNSNAQTLRITRILFRLPIPIP